MEVSCPEKHAKMVPCIERKQKFDCKRLVEVTCSRQHKNKVLCHLKANSACQQCVEEDREVERRAKRDLDLEKERQARQAEYKQELAQIKDEIDRHRRIIKYQQDAEQNSKDLSQAKETLAALKKTAAKVSKPVKHAVPTQTQAQSQQAMPGTWPSGNGSPVAPKDLAPSQAREEWEQLKEQEGAKSQPLDELMSMIGLEEVKGEFLSIKSRVDTALRQEISLENERFSASMLGNPGTG